LSNQKMDARASVPNLKLPPARLSFPLSFSQHRY